MPGLKTENRISYLFSQMKKTAKKSALKKKNQVSKKAPVKKTSGKKQRKLGKKHAIAALVIIILVTNLVGLGFYLKSAHKVKAQTITSEIGPSPTPEPTPTSTPSASPSAAPAVIRESNYGFGVPILTYHYIGNNPNPKDTARNSLEVVPDKFETQMNYLAENGYTPISPETLYAIFNKQTTVNKPIMLTFDDGYVDFYLNAFPILSKHHFHAVAFIPTGLMGTGYYMNWGQIKEIQSSGLVSFEDHSITHPNLTTMGYDEILRQLKESRDTLQSQTGAPVNFVAYPYGAANNLVFEAAKKVGYIGGFGTWAGKATGPGIDMPRIRIAGQISLQDFISKL